MAGVKNPESGSGFWGGDTHVVSCRRLFFAHKQCGHGFFLELFIQQARLG